MNRRSTPISASIAIGYSARFSSQLLSKLVRGFRQDLEDAERFLADGLVDSERFLEPVSGIPDTAYARHPNLSRQTVLDAVNDFLSGR